MRDKLFISIYAMLGEALCHAERSEAGRASLSLRVFITCYIELYCCCVPLCPCHLLIRSFFVFVVVRSILRVVVRCSVHLGKDDLRTG